MYNNSRTAKSDTDRDYYPSTIRSVALKALTAGIVEGILAAPAAAVEASPDGNEAVRVALVNLLLDGARDVEPVTIESVDPESGAVESEDPESEPVESEDPESEPVGPGDSEPVDVESRGADSGSAGP